jgi:hypothetical protein
MATAAAQHAAISHRYKRKLPFIMAMLRVAELHRLFRDRYPGGDCYELPPDDSGRHDLHLLLHHLVNLHGDPQRMRKAIKARAPWLPADEADRKIRGVFAQPIKWRANTLGKELGLTESVRRRLDIRTIGTIDMTPQERREARRLRQRQRDRSRRRARGAKPQANSINRNKPWLAAGISRATWYRQRETTSRAI